MNVIPSRRVKGLLQIVDAIDANAVKLYTEKKCEVQSELGEGGIAPDSAKDLMSIFRGCHSRNHITICGVANI